MGCAAGGTQFFGVFITQLVEGKGAALGDFKRVRHRFGAVGKQLQHGGRGFQIALAIGEDALAKLGHGAAVAHGGQNVLQGSALANVIVNAVGGNE